MGGNAIRVGSCHDRPQILGIGPVIGGGKCYAAISGAGQFDSHVLSQAFSDIESGVSDVERRGIGIMHDHQGVVRNLKIVFCD